MFTKFIFNLIKTQLEDTQPLRFELNRHAWTEFKKFLPTPFLYGESEHASNLAYALIRSSRL